MTDPAATKYQLLKANGTWNPHAQRIRDPLFQELPFFDAYDLLQVKYEMVRRVQVEAWSVTQAAAAFGLSRPAFYQAQHAFQQQGLSGLVPQRRGPKAGHKLTPEVLAFIQNLLAEEPTLSSTLLAQRLAQHLELSVHPRSIDRALQRPEKK